MPLLVHPAPAGLPQKLQHAGKNLAQQTLSDKQQIQTVAGPRSHMKSMRRTVEELFLRLMVGTQLRLLAGGLLLSGYFALLAAGF